MMGVVPGRVTFVIDRQGIIRHVFSSITQIDQHVGEALAIVKKLQTEDQIQDQSQRASD